MDKDTLKELLIGVLIFILITVGVVLFVNGCNYWWAVNVCEKNIINVVVDNKVVFTGKKAFVLIESGGITTTVTIYSKLFPWQITDKVYSSSNVAITNKGE